MMNTLSKELVDSFKKFNRVVIWGLYRKVNSYRFIHQHFYDALKKCGVPAVWVEDSRRNQKLVQDGDLVIGVNFAIEHLPRRENVYYCLHNISVKEFNPERSISLQVYTNTVEQESEAEKWNEVTFFDKNNRILYQPWATDLLPHEFRKPVVKVDLPLKKLVFWIGSIWNNEQNQGNMEQIRGLKGILRKRGLFFVHPRYVPNWIHVLLIRASRIAPAVAGNWQVENDYLPCRMWKNISYGHLGVSNVLKFRDVFSGCSVEGDDVEELIENTLSMSSCMYRDMTLAQQEIVKRDHTYISRLLNISRALECLG